MASLSNADRLAIWADWMRTNQADTPFTKDELRVAVDLMDEWADANAGDLVTSISSAAVGDATYDETGGGVEDEWTLTAHGLAVDDVVQFSAVGTGATGYAASTDYWVVAVPTANTFQLSGAKGAAPLEGTGDSAGTWTVQQRNAQEFVDNTTAAQKAHLFAEVVRKRYDVGA